MFNSDELRAIAQMIRLQFITVEVRVQFGIFSGQNSTGANILLFCLKYKATYLYIIQDWHSAIV